ncbi:MULTISPECIES: bacteriophage Gp15 family protein [Clostridium]|uniref:bacteriophage Gp15 family protein n=1 Tax=Clostridium disporicum TaxID=84024 RepID=UPI0006C3DCC8|nr:bacteriophage Gp15 family protein [Clostridium disporicum]CUN36919.1 protein gp15 [Clostridium disporicum]
MNLLIDLVPKTITIDNKEYEINSDFRTSILFELLMQDKSIKDNDKIYLALELYYPNIPDDINSAIEKMLWFYRCGKDLITSKRKGKGKSDIKIYSFEYDDDYIYAAFMDQYGIDLQDIKYLHWWKFKAMFKSLKEDTEIVKIMRYRSMDLSKIKDKNEKAYYKKMQELYKIPISKDEQEKLEEIERALLNGEDVSKLL